MYKFDAKGVKEEVVGWIREWFAENGPGCNAVVGISGGKDSSVVAALCVEALGKDRVIGVLMPNGMQEDINYSYALVSALGIHHLSVNIADAIAGLYERLTTRSKGFGEDVITTIKNDGEYTETNPITYPITKKTIINLPARMRMVTLYAIAQSVNGRVANTCNLSEDWVGYSTRYGDSVGDFSPLSHLTSEEVVEVGRELGLPKELIEKTPSDGLSGKTDEDAFGFTYHELNNYIRGVATPSEETMERINRMHKANLFKLEPMPVYEPNHNLIFAVPDFMN